MEFVVRGRATRAEVSRSFYCAAAVVNTIIICNVQYICIYAKSMNGAAGAIGVSYFWRYSCGRHLCRRREAAKNLSTKIERRILPRLSARPRPTPNCLHIFRMTCSCLPKLTPQAPFRRFTCFFRRVCE